jgi:hypothetical protein
VLLAGRNQAMRMAARIAAVQRWGPGSTAMAVMAKPPATQHVAMVKKPLVRACTITLVTAW